jgi:hypothetical protein
MDKDLEKYFENQFDMIASQGWKDLMDTVNSMIKKETDILSIKNAEDLFKRQGRLDILNWIVSWKDTCEFTIKVLENEENL